MNGVSEIAPRNHVKLGSETSHTANIPGSEANRFSTLTSSGNYTSRSSSN